MRMTTNAKNSSLESVGKKKGICCGRSLSLSCGSKTSREEAGGSGSKTSTLLLKRTCSLGRLEGSFSFASTIASSPPSPTSRKTEFLLCTSIGSDSSSGALSSHEAVLRNSRTKLRRRGSFDNERYADTRAGVVEYAEPEAGSSPESRDSGDAIRVIRYLCTSVRSTKDTGA